MRQKIKGLTFLLSQPTVYWDFFLDIQGQTHFMGNFEMENRLTFMKYLYERKNANKTFITIIKREVG